MALSFDQIFNSGDANLEINEDFFKSIIFQGFDPAAIRKKMTVKNATPFDIAKLVGLFLTRGSNIEKILGSTSSVGAAAIRKMSHRLFYQEEC